MKRVKFEQEKVKKVAKFLKEGKVLVFPTDTVYGIICDAFNQDSVSRIYKIKDRPKKKPLPLFVSSISQVKRFAFVNRQKEEFLKEIWPGNVTVVLERKNNTEKLFGVRKDTIAFRIPDYKGLLEVLGKISPLVETSANISGEKALVKPEKIEAEFENRNVKPDIIFDSGNLGKTSSSTVLDLTGDSPKVLREGDFSLKEE